WQRDANAVALRLLKHADYEAFVLNVTSPEPFRVRDLAERIGARLGRAPAFTGAESETALVSNALKMRRMFGEPEVSVDQAIEIITDWVKAGGASLNKPTHFDERGGKF